jgi:putative glutamine amidotransferase
MARSPLILISPSIEKSGVEFHDISSSLSLRYESAILAAGGIPVVAPATTDRAALAESVRRTDGVLLTGGDDINPQLYADQYQPKLSAKILKTVEQTPDHGGRDMRELVLIEEIFRQKKPVLGICRGHQMLHVAFGGRLIVDIKQQIRGALNHQQSEKQMELVHEATLTPGSLVSKICKTRVLGVNSTHHQGIAEPVDPFVATARSRDGIVEALELQRGFDLPFFLSVQFHPERLVQRHARYRAIFQKFVAACAKNIKTKNER